MNALQFLGWALAGAGAVIAVSLAFAVMWAVTTAIFKKDRK